MGTARIARERVIPAMQSVSNCNIAAIASRSLKTARRAAQLAGIGRSHGSYEALLADPAVEAVYLPLPNHLHVEWCAKTLEAGKHVLCEKPIALDAASAQALIELRDREGLLIEEAFAIRNHPQWAAMRALLASGEIGTLKSVQATLAYSNLDANDIRNLPQTGGGALYDIGSYAIAACRLLFDSEPVRVVAMIERDDRFGIDGLTTAMLEFAHGHASFSVTTQGGPTTGGTHQHLAAVTTGGWMRAEFPFAHSAPRECRLFIGDEHSVGTFPAREMAFPAVDQYALQAQRFSRLVRGMGAESFALETAVANMRVLDALFQSARSGRWEHVERNSDAGR